MVNPMADEWLVRVSPDLSRPNMTVAAIVPRQPTRAERESGMFLHLDCGLWAGKGRRSGGRYSKHREFGIVYGNWAVLCKFQRLSGNPGASDTPISHADDGMRRELVPVNRLIHALAGNNRHVKVVKSMRYHGSWPRTPRPDRIEVFVPDMHVPVLSGRPQVVRTLAGLNRELAPDGPVNGRWGYYDSSSSMLSQTLRPRVRGSDGTVPTLGGDRVLGVGAEQWFDKYEQADIYESASEDMLHFLDRLEQARDLPTVEVIQLGDFVDLWIGFERFFEEVGWRTRVPPPRVNLTEARTSSRGPLVDGAVVSPSGASFVDHWLARATASGSYQGQVANSPRNAEVLRRFASSLPNVHFIEGNHDCYLAHEDALGLERVGGLRGLSYEHDRLVAEHGHEGDSHNRDGCAGFWGGHNITQVVFDEAAIRQWEWLVNDARAVVLKYIARKFHRLNDAGHGFAIMVTGHDHLAGLGRVCVTDEAPAPDPPTGSLYERTTLP